MNGYQSELALRKLQSFVEHYKVANNRYISSPNLMSFDDTPNFITNTKENYSSHGSSIEDESELEDEELIDVETIYPYRYCCMMDEVRKVLLNLLLCELKNKTYLAYRLAFNYIIFRFYSLLVNNLCTYRLLFVL